MQLKFNWAKNFNFSKNVSEILYLEKISRTYFHLLKCITCGLMHLSTAHHRSLSLFEAPIASYSQDLISIVTFCIYNHRWTIAFRTPSPTPEHPAFPAASSTFSTELTYHSGITTPRLDLIKDDGTRLNTPGQLTWIYLDFWLLAALWCYRPKSITHT